MDLLSGITSTATSSTNLLLPLSWAWWPVSLSAKDASLSPLGRFSPPGWPSGAWSHWSCDPDNLTLALTHCGQPSGCPHVTLPDDVIYQAWSYPMAKEVPKGWASGWKLMSWLALNCPTLPPTCPTSMSSCTSLLGLQPSTISTAILIAWQLWLWSYYSFLILTNSCLPLFRFCHIFSWPFSHLLSHLHSITMFWIVVYLFLFSHTFFHTCFHTSTQ